MSKIKNMSKIREIKNNSKPKLFKEFSVEAGCAWIRKNAPDNNPCIPYTKIKKLIEEVRKDFPETTDEEMYIFYFFGPEYRQPGYAVGIPMQNPPTGYRQVR